MVIEVIIDLYKSKDIDKATASYLDPLESLEKKTSVFYMLPKIHNNNKKATNLLADQLLLNRILEFIDHYLLPEVQRLPTYLKDTSDTIRKMETLTLPDNIVIATIDVVSMFISVPQEVAFEIFPSIGFLTLQKCPQREVWANSSNCSYTGTHLSLMVIVTFNREAFQWDSEAALALDI